MKVTLEKEVPNHRFVELMLVACETPFGSWLRKYQWSPAISPYVLHFGDTSEEARIDRLEPGALVVTVWMEDPSDEDLRIEKKLTLEDICAGVQRLLSHENKNYRTLGMQCLVGDEDAVGADAALQMAVYKEAVYG